jgi:SAM-dependent methyltransferase
MIMAFHDAPIASRGTMGFYRNVILPKLCDLSMRNKRLRPYRVRVIGAAEGRVLEIGAGSGLNLQLYRSGAREVLALEPDQRLLRMAERNAKNAPRPVTFLEASAEDIPLEDRSVDTVVTTWTLCTVPDADRALGEARRVLKTAGKLLFVEHGLAPERNVQKWQNRLTPVWTTISGGCHLNRPIAQIIETAGFAIERLETGYLPGPKFLAFLSEGSARPS